MRIDVEKMKSLRERQGLTQEALAHRARINVRTVQRAEKGEPLRAETLQDIAAVLGLTVSAIQSEGPQKEPEVQEAEDAQNTQVLKRCDGGEVVVSALERATMSHLGCTAEPTEENMPALRAIIQQIEKLMLSPFDDDWEALPPLRFSSLLDRLETVAALNKALGALEKDGMALYLTTSTKYVKVPYRVDEGFMATHSSQEPEYIQAVRFHIAEYIGERLRLPDNVSWILPDEDDDIPF